MQHHLPQPPDLGVDVECHRGQPFAGRIDGNEKRARALVEHTHRGAPERDPRPRPVLPWEFIAMSAAGSFSA